MTLHCKHILPLLLTLITLSCGEVEVDRQSKENNSDLSINKIFYPEYVSNTYFDPFLLGKKFRITHESYGCFNYNTTYIDVEENNGSYVVILKDRFSNKAYRPAQLDSHFALPLRDFNNYYSRLLADTSRQILKNENYLGTVNRLTIQGGFKTTVIFCDNRSELSGFNNLVNRVNLLIAARNTRHFANRWHNH